MLTDKEKEILLPKFHEYNLKHRFISWAYAQREDDKEIEKIVEMTSRPCYGEMRAYGPKSTRPTDHKPGDLPRPMKPAGGDTGIFREAVAVSFTPQIQKDEDIPVANRWYEFLFGPNSIYIAGLDQDNLEFTKNDKGLIKGVVMTGTEVDPTCMVAAFMANRGGNLRTMETFGKLVDAGMTEREAFLVAFNFSLYVYGNSDFFLFTKPMMPYMQNPMTNIKKALSADFNRELSNNRTWRDGEDYNRPNLADGFVLTATDKDSLQHLMDGLETESVKGMYQPGIRLEKAIEAIRERFSAILS